jgi:hypothetical protein
MDRVRIGQRDLAVRRGFDLGFHNLQRLHLGAQGGDLVLQLPGPRLGRLTLLPVGGVEIGQIARDVLGNLLHPFLQLGRGEVLVAGVHRLELAAVHRRQRLGEEPDLAAQHHEVRAGSLDSGAVILPVVGDGLVIRRELPRQPHQLDLAPSLPLQPPARRHAVHVAVDVELQQGGRMLGGPSRRRGRHGKAQTTEIELIYEHVDHPRRVVFQHVVIEATGKQGRLSAVFTFDEAGHLITPNAAASSVYSASCFYTASTLRRSLERPLLGIRRPRCVAARGDRAAGSRWANMHAAALN